jgi:hypothetical protein
MERGQSPFLRKNGARRDLAAHDLQRERAQPQPHPCPFEPALLSRDELEGWVTTRR